jgi:hypothetical protein
MISWIAVRGDKQQTSDRKKGFVIYLYRKWADEERMRILDVF